MQLVDVLFAVPRDERPHQRANVVELRSEPGRSTTTSTTCPAHRQNLEPVAGLEDLDTDVEAGARPGTQCPPTSIDRFGVIRWLNAAAERIVGDVRGWQITSVLAPEERRRGREIFMRNLTRPACRARENRGVVLTEDGERISIESERGAARSRVARSSASSEW